MAQVKWRFSFTCGALLRRHFIRELRKGAMMLNVELEVNEDKGWLDSFFYGTATGEEADVQKWIEGIKGFVKALEEE